MKDTVLIFAGTVEGRELASFCSQQNIDAHVCVATEYGEELVEDLPGIQVHMGRMDQGEMEAMLAEIMPYCVIDATHPYADIVTKNITAACEAKGIHYQRLVRTDTDLDSLPGIIPVESAKEAAEYVDARSGAVFLTTGFKELPVFAENIKDKSRIYARLLLQETLFSKMEELGLTRAQLICMQGPFSKELNKAMFSQVHAAFVITKESGAAGGFREKVDAAAELNIPCIVIRRPVKESGMSLEQVKQFLCPQYKGLIMADNPEISVSVREAEKPRRVTLLGIGMGAESSMTVEAVHACEQADLIIGAGRMLKTLKVFGKPMVSMYKSDEIRDYILEHPQYRQIVIGLSGDVGFYSGSKKLIRVLEQADETILLDEICGISSVIYMAARLQMPWEDMALCSAHGRQQNLVAAVRTNKKVFCLVSDAASVRKLAELLVDYGFGAVTMHVGVDLSYPTESMHHGTVEHFLNFEEPGICAVVLENPEAGSQVVTHGIPDEAFLRDKVPMTKEEVRSVALSKLRLTRDSVVYDVGSGTGSVSVECARIADRGTVYAIERKPEAIELTERNKRHFGVSNLQVVAGLAPEALTDLPAPTHAFIGGSGGNLKEIVALLREKNPAVRIVITCIAMDTTAEAMEILKTTDPAESDICTVNISRSKKLGNYQMMMGQNPVTIFTLQYSAEK